MFQLLLLSLAAAAVYLLLAGIILSIFALCSWGRGGFGALVPEEIMRTTIPAVTLIAIGVQAIFSGFVMSIIKVKEKKNQA